MRFRLVGSVEEEEEEEEEEQRWIKDERGENDRIGDNSAGIGRNWYFGDV